MSEKDELEAFKVVPLSVQLTRFRNAHWMHWADPADNALISECIKALDSYIHPMKVAQTLDGLRAVLHPRANPNDPSAHHVKGWNAALTNAKAALVPPNPGATP